MSAFRGNKADMTFCTANVRYWHKADIRVAHTMSAFGVKRTWLIAAQMSAFDPKRTLSNRRLF